jgi:hypothetical protein
VRRAPCSRARARRRAGKLKSLFSGEGAAAADPAGHRQFTYTAPKQPKPVRASRRPRAAPAARPAVTRAGQAAPEAAAGMKVIQAFTPAVYKYDTGTKAYVSLGKIGLAVLGDRASKQVRGRAPPRACALTAPKRARLSTSCSCTSPSRTSSPR